MFNDIRFGNGADFTQPPSVEKSDLENESSFFAFLENELGVPVDNINIEAKQALVELHGSNKRAFQELKAVLNILPANEQPTFLNVFSLAKNDSVFCGWLVYVANAMSVEQAAKLF